MVSIDNAVELMAKTYLGLPKRARGGSGPSRKELDDASESFPALLDLMDRYDSDKISGLSLDDIEWYHRLRNQLYHSGNGITVERSKVETYLQLAMTLFESLFGVPPEIDRRNVVKTKTGEFLTRWNELQALIRKKFPPKEPGDLAYYWKRDQLEQRGPGAAVSYDLLALFRNALVHGTEAPEPDVIDSHLKAIDRLEKLIKGKG